MSLKFEGGQKYFYLSNSKQKLERFPLSLGTEMIKILFGPPIMQSVLPPPCAASLLRESLQSETKPLSFSIGLLKSSSLSLPSILFMITLFCRYARAYSLSRSLYICHSPTNGSLPTAISLNLSPQQYK